MLTPVEQLLFIVLALLAIGATAAGFAEMYQIVNRGRGELYLDNLPRRLWDAITVYLTQKTTLKTRRVTSLIHLGVVLGFTYYFLVNFGDLLEGFIGGGYRFLRGAGLIYDLYKLFGDLLSLAVIGGVIYFVLRRYLLPSKKDLHYHANVLLHPKVKDGAINRDSLIVAVFILIHVGARFLGTSVLVAEQGAADPWRPFASLIAPVWGGSEPDTLKALEHLFWWLALGGILLFTPYFPYTKHAHLFMAPLNFLTRPRRTSLGEMEKLDFEDETVEQFGANKLEDLTKTNLFDGFACIMCNRCQDACPAHTTGKSLSPSALEINKRYFLNDEGGAIAAGQESGPTLLEFAISEEAVWACTACGACVQICPVGNEPMRDILEIRRNLAMMESSFPKQLETAFKGMERNMNPWNVSQADRMKWAAGLEVPTIEQNPEPEILWWVGCAPATDARAQKTARAFADQYRAQGPEFPPECRSADYEKRIQAAFPIHPEIFDRLYEDWSTLVKFQRTRGVLRLMAAVIHSLWEKGDRGPLILPSSIPIDDGRVQNELTRYLSDNWVPIIERDVDGPNSTPLRNDGEHPNLGRLSATRRVARTIYLGSAPTTGASHLGLEDRQVKLGCVLPGESPAIFADAIRRLATTATYLYQDGPRSWYSTQPTVTRLAEDRAEQLKREPDRIAQELDRRLRENLRATGDFTRIHPLPQTGADVADDRESRLVVLGSAHLYAKDGGGGAVKMASTILESRGSGPRLYRNTLVFLAADATRMRAPHVLATPEAAIRMGDVPGKTLWTFDPDVVLGPCLLSGREFTPWWEGVWAGLSASA